MMKTRDLVIQLQECKETIREALIIDKDADMLESLIDVSTAAAEVLGRITVLIDALEGNEVARELLVNRWIEEVLEETHDAEALDRVFDDAEEEEKALEVSQEEYSEQILRELEEASAKRHFEELYKEVSKILLAKGYKF